MGGGEKKILRLPSVQAVQDVAPLGGYKNFVMRGNKARRGPPGWAIWLALATSTTYGMYQLSLTNSNKRHNYKEKRENRMAILPYLVAEQDRQRQSIYDADCKVEAEIMKDVDGWVVGQSVYKKRWMQPTPGLAEMNSFTSPKLKNED